MEILRPNPAPGRLRFAVFDFDGTLSLLRAGWQRVMSDLMVEALQGTPRAEAEDHLRARISEPIFGLAGRPTIIQMEWLVDEVRQRGGTPQTAEAYKQQYLVRLSERIEHWAELEAGRQPPERFRVPGALEFVAALHARDVACYIASGTDETAVREEVALLGLAPLIAGLRGAREDGSDAKHVVINHLAARHRLSTGELAVIGDGSAEIEYARAASGLAIGVASTEDERSGIDARKRSLLIAAGADVIIPDFSQPAELLAYLWPAG
ncbi:MAG TPA: HAD family hydrolase [Anaerolineales bacterium]|nr:HAD family hydrolase [Anaerolineales bacterium]